MLKGREVRQTDFACHLAAKFGCGRLFEPVLAWTVDENGKVKKVSVVMVRGSCDYYHSHYNYAEIDVGSGSRDTISSRYIFPWRTHTKPRLVEMQDEYGTFRDWLSTPRKR